MVKKIAHVGIAARSVSDAAGFFELLGMRIDSVELIEDQNVKAALLNVGESALELLEATDADSPVARFLEKRGEGLHHITLEVDDLEGELRKLRSANVSLIDERPRVGAMGRLVAFVHPRSAGGVLVELTQSVEGVD